MNLYLIMTVAYKDIFPAMGIKMWFNNIKFKYNGKEYLCYPTNDANVSYSFNEANDIFKTVVFEGVIKGVEVVDEKSNILPLTLEEIFGDNINYEQFELLSINCSLSDNEKYFIKDVKRLSFIANDGKEYLVNKNQNSSL